MEFPDTVGKLEKHVVKDLQASLNWSEHAAKDVYHGLRNLMPVPDQYKDATAAALGTVALIAAAKVIPRPLLREILAGSTETATWAAKAEGVSIVPLTHDNLSAAIAAGKDGFRYGRPFLNPAKDFKASLDPVLNAKVDSLDPKVEANARYWLAIDKQNNVLGTTGLYESGRDQSEASWLGWMSVRSAYRGQGIGKQLVDFSVEQARADGKQFLRLYTSTAKGESDAQFLYEKNGFKIVGSEPHTIPRFVQRILGEKQPLKILFRELDLTTNDATKAGNQVDPEIVTR